MRVDGEKDGAVVGQFESQQVAGQASSMMARTTRFESQQSGSEHDNPMTSAPHDGALVGGNIVGLKVGPQYTLQQVAGQTWA